jgi:hypothetical protein
MGGGMTPARGARVEEADTAWLDKSEDDGVKHADWMGRLRAVSCGA